MFYFPEIGSHPPLSEANIERGKGLGEGGEGRGGQFDSTGLVED